ncbi:MAG: putative beta-lysine N-acetyltransferase [Candidatus Marinimicrobia bacterium]|nr:putative beta-lysine N-acetyltransferase [Candidatus Neomarinimicrobiota bacterium]MCF7851103.1 putative beta-lysine N-acetyltransferase [Candidatus Neomarinimicrobiota bacterium]MCF7904349.1 putative beta-lysine N-acetyltransferase [Candidatus Neomarinimicrobiota bacterium]
MIDSVIQIGQSILQHGTFNDRVYLMGVHPGDETKVIKKAESLADSNGYSKIFAKVSSKSIDSFTAKGYQVEAQCGSGTAASENLVFLSKFLDQDRKQEQDPGHTEKVIKTAQDEYRETPQDLPLDKGMNIIEADFSHADLLAELYTHIFKSYPFPIQDPFFLMQEMTTGTRYFCLMQDNELLGAASIEQSADRKTAEMTDFAVKPVHRGKQIAERLLRHMEKVLQDSPVAMCYTIARAKSYGMNITFARCGYQYGGTLINNTNIGGSIESMNVWFRRIKD